MPFGTQASWCWKLAQPTKARHALPMPKSMPSSRMCKCPERATDMILSGKHTLGTRLRLSLWYQEASTRIDGICRRELASFDKPVDPWVLVAQLHAALIATKPASSRNAG
jgi:hypothetical protein